MTSVASANERLERLEQLVPLCGQIRQGTEYGAALAQAANEVGKAAALPLRLERIEPALRVLQGTQHLPADDVLQDLGKLETAGHNLEKSVNTEALRDARFSVKDIHEALQRVEAAVSKAWVARVQADFGPLERLGTVLAGIPDTKQAGIALQRWAKRALGVAEGGAPTIETVKQFEEVQAEVPGHLEALGKLGIDADVRAFLVEVAGERATLATMTSEVLEWLQAKKAQSRFRIELI